MGAEEAHRENEKAPHGTLAGCSRCDDSNVGRSLPLVLHEQPALGGFAFLRLHVRHAFIGFCSAAVSDTCSNSLRVLKTTRQTALEPISYMDSARHIVEKEGLAGLFGRGLKTRILTNGIQGALFTVGWKSISEYLNKQ